MLTPCKSKNALVSKCTSLGIVCDSLRGAKLAEHRAKFRIKPITALTKGHLEGGCKSWATQVIPSLKPSKIFVNCDIERQLLAQLQ